MTYLSFQDGRETGLVLDTSVLINLQASRYGSRVLGALKSKVIVPQAVAREVSRESAVDQFLAHLTSSGKAEVAALNAREHEIFERLVSGNPTLGDGEAATIAVAFARSELAIIDERKGRQLALMLNCKIGWSLDLFFHPNVHNDLGDKLVADLVYFALRDGRMRIPDEKCDYVVGKIGTLRALECRSLPGYKSRHVEWRANL